MKFKKIKSLKALKKISASPDGAYKEFFISLGGIARSSKNISYSPIHKTFCIINEIDDSFDEDLTEEELKSQTNIYDAIKAGKFYQYLYD
jgi:hypothetical protein